MRGIWLAGVCAFGACAAPDETGVEDLELLAGPVFNGEIAYGRMTPIPDGGGGGTGFSVVVVDRDGSDLTRLPSGSEVPFEFDPAFSPGGKKVAFVSGSAADYSDSEIYRMNADGSCVTRLTQALARSYDPDWSPDGRKIAFARRCRIFTMNADGSGVAELLPGSCNLVNSSSQGPRWSPDGNKILFYSDQTGNGEVFTINPDGTGLVNLTNHPDLDWYADWSPDGSKIVFMRGGGGGPGALHVMDADGGNPTYLFGPAQNPSWSPDGERIAFVGDDEDRTDGRLHIFKISAEGSGLRFVSDDAWPGSRIDWGPRFDGVFVTWMSAVGVTTTCNSLTKSASGQNLWDAGAASVETLEGDGALEFTTAENTTQKLAGLSSGDDGQDRQDIDFGIYLRDDGALVVSERSSFHKPVGTYAAGDVFRIRVLDGVVTYWQNGVRLYRSQAAPTFPLLVDTALRTPGATIQDVTLDAD